MLGECLRFSGNAEQRFQPLTIFGQFIRPHRPVEEPGFTKQEIARASGGKAATENIAAEDGMPDFSDLWVSGGAGM